MNSVVAWLAHLEAAHPKTIDLGLTRCRAVYERLDARPQCPVITVTGTNGKGSVCAMAESIYRAEGLHTALYTSPHILRFQERIRIDGSEVDDATLCAAFEAVESARAAAAVSLTYFEFTTLAAFWVFARAKLDVWVLEVGLGGRLDTTNLVDADCAVVTSIGLDHAEFLGNTRESVAREKIGIARAGRPVICGEPHPPESLLEGARVIGASLVRVGVDFFARSRDLGEPRPAAQWDFIAAKEVVGPSRQALPMPALRGQFQIGNAALALAALNALKSDLPVRAESVRQGLLTVSWPGRLQVLPGQPTTVLDVAHNPHAAQVLAQALGDMAFYPRTIAVLGMLADKDFEGVLSILKDRIDIWHVASTAGTRGLPAQRLVQALLKLGVPERAISGYDDPASAYVAAQKIAHTADRIVVFGSFVTVAAVMGTT